MGQTFNRLQKSYLLRPVQFGNQKKKLFFNADVGDSDGQSQNLLLQYYTNGGNAMIHFLNPIDEDVTISIYEREYTLAKQLDNSVRIYDNDGVVLKSGVTNIGEELARNFRNLVQDEITNGNIFNGTNLAVSFMQENLFSFFPSRESMILCFKQSILGSIASNLKIQKII